MSILSDELTTDVLVRGYAGMSDAAVAADLHLLYRPKAADPNDLLQYFLSERFSGSFLYGRLEIAARQVPGAVDPLGQTVTFTVDHIAAAHTMLAIINPNFGAVIDLSDTNMDALLDDLAGGQGAKVIGPANKTALQALSENKQSRSTELGINKQLGYPVDAAAVAAARA